MAPPPPAAPAFGGPPPPGPPPPAAGPGGGGANSLKDALLLKKTSLADANQRATPDIASMSVDESSSLAATLAGALSGIRMAVSDGGDDDEDWSDDDWSE